jgi:hypothetical protein
VAARSYHAADTVLLFSACENVGVQRTTHQNIPNHSLHVPYFEGIL